jgi:hypothetical protein
MVVKKAELPLLVEDSANPAKPDLSVKHARVREGSCCFSV